MCLEKLTQGRPPPLSVKTPMFDVFKELMTLHKLTPTSDARDVIITFIWTMFNTFLYLSSVGPDQTAHKGAVLSGSALLAIETI